MSIDKVSEQIDELLSNVKYSPMAVMISSAFFILNSIIVTSAAKGADKNAVAKYLAATCIKFSDAFLGLVDEDVKS